MKHPRESIVTDTAIKGFFGQYRFLSNFHLAPVTYERVVYPSTEHAYQAAKHLPGRRHECGLMDALAAKHWGATAVLDKEEWDKKKLKVMYDVIFDKFQYHARLKQKLLETGDKEIVELNDWGDQLWGVTEDGVGRNLLGRVLMLVREDVKAGAARSVAAFHAATKDW
jgi:ribA/ribD-fused uncharacterized protein